MPPININYEPTPFLQVMGSWWGQRRQMAHGVAVQEAQIGLQHSAQAQQSFQSGMTGLRQGAAAYQQAQQFEAGLSQQQQQFDASNQRLYDMAYLPMFGATKNEIPQMLEQEIANETVSPDMTVVQYRRKLASEQLKLVNEPAFARQANAYHLRATGMPTFQLDELAEQQGIPRHELVAQISQQRQMQQAQAQQGMMRQAEEEGRILRAAQNQPPTSETGQALARFREANTVLNLARQGHGIPQGQTQAGWLKNTQAMSQEAFGDVRNALVKTQPDPAKMQEDFENNSQHVDVLNPHTGEAVATITTVRLADGTNKTFQTTMPDSAGAGTMNPIWKYYDGLARKTQVYDEEFDDLVAITDETEIARIREKGIQEYKRAHAPPISQEDQRTDRLARQPYQPEDLAKVQQAAEQTIAQLRQKQKTGQPLTPEERQAFERAYNMLHPQQPETLQHAPAQDPAVDEARQVIRQLLAKRQAGEQLTKEERGILQAARDVLARATQ